MPSPENSLVSIPTRLVAGHRVASGRNGDPRFPGGTIRMQVPHFRKRGLDLAGFHPATLNLSITPLGFEILQPRITFRGVRWHPSEPEEDFSFFDCRIRSDVGASGAEPRPDWVEGLIYYPHPETKPEHFQEGHVLEVVAKSLLPGIEYGDTLLLETNPGQIRFFPGDAGG